MFEGKRRRCSGMHEGWGKVPQDGAESGERRTLSLCFLASAAGVGLRRSTARTCR